MRILAMFLLAGAFFGPSHLSGQRILYNKDLDDKGKAADAAAKKLSSSSTTGKELQNLAVLEKAQIERVLNAATVTMRREVESLSRWSSALKLADAIQENIGDVAPPFPDATQQEKDAMTQQQKDALEKRQKEVLAQQLKDVDAQRKALKDSLKLLEGASKQKPPSLDRAIEILGDVKDLTDFAGEAGKIKETKDVSASMQKVIDGLKEINTLIDTVHTIWSSARALKVDPSSLAPSVEETELAVLAAETQYLKELTLLRARQHDDYAEVRSILDELRQEIKQEFKGDKLAEGHQIRGDLAAIAAQMSPNDNYDGLREQMRARVHILHLAASAAAQNMIATDIEKVRETLAWRRYQIRSTAVYNGAYETAILAASDRLAAYYGAGLKPTQIAQLLHDLAATVSLPTIAF